MKQTTHIQIDTHKCTACWKCIEGCSNRVLRKINLPWHKHARIKNDERCTGCLKCLKACDAGALTKIPGRGRGAL